MLVAPAHLAMFIVAQVIIWSAKYCALAQPCATQLERHEKLNCGMPVGWMQLNAHDTTPRQFVLWQVPQSPGQFEQLS